MGRLTHMPFRHRRVGAPSAFLTVAVVLSACTLESPVSVTDRPLAEQLEDRRALDAQAIAADDEVPAEAPTNLAFAEALASGEFVRLHVTNEGVPARLRSGPGSAYELLTDVPSGTEVLATGNRTGEWIHVMYADFDGWLNSMRITFDEVTDEQLIAPDDVDRTPVTYVVVGEAIGVNIRAEPDATSDLVSGAPAGSVVTGSGNTDGTWIEVTYEGVTGWASGNYLEPGDGSSLGPEGASTTTVAETLNTDE